LSYKSGDNYYVFYVGKSDKIKERLLQHIAPSEDNLCIKTYVSTKECYFRYAKVSQSYIREAAEHQMYKHYVPTCNEIEPPGRDDVKVNLS
jgi:excinuclease UvrABC nuclease subunit